jgi:cytochrome c oxidase cbb3-type subunit III
VTESSKQKLTFCPKNKEGGLPSLARILLVFCATGPCALLAFTRAAVPAQMPSASAFETGRQIFASACAGCHGLDGRGGARAPNIAKRAEVRRQTDQEIFRLIHDGSASRAMPAFGTMFNAIQIRAVIQYLRVLEGARSAAALPGDPRAGKLLFFGQADCSNCHTVEGEGGFIAGDLSDYAATKSPDEIRAAITSPDASSDPRQRLATVTTQTGTQIIGRLRNEDNFSIQLQSLDGSFHLLDKSEVRSIAFDGNPLMPSDYSTKLSSKQMDAIVSFLMSTAFAGSPAASSGRPPIPANQSKME